jgi:hypothetical protein
VDAVIPKERFFVTAAIAEIGCTSCQPYFRHLSDPTHNRGIGHRPLGCSTDAVVQAVVVSVVSAIRVCKEESVDATTLQQLRQVDPVI